MKNPSNCPWCKSVTFVDEGSWFTVDGNGEPGQPSAPFFQVQCSAPCSACGPTKATAEEAIEAWDGLCAALRVSTDVYALLRARGVDTPARVAHFFAQALNAHRTEKPTT